MTDYKCRAKNPATCRVHGSPNPMTALMNFNVAFANLRNSKKAAELATNLEELSEAKQLVYFDQKVYDATLAGKAELDEKLKPWRDPRPTLSEELEYRARKAEGEAYRNEMLAGNKAFAASEESFAKITGENAIASYTLNDKQSVNAAINALWNLPVGTPVAIKTKSGGYLYGGAGDGLSPEANRNTFLNKRYRGRFLQKAEASISGEAFISLKNSSLDFRLKDVKEIHVLKADTFKDGMSAVYNPYSTKAEETSAYSRYGIEGEGYYYELEGNSNERQAWREGGAQGDGVYLDPYNVTTVSKIEPS